MESFRKIEELPGQPQETIRPEDVEVKKGPLGYSFSGDFSKAEIEHAALVLVLFFRAKRGWVPFTAGELLDFYRATRLEHPERMFYGLTGMFFDDGGEGQWIEPLPYLILGHDGRYRVTNLFVRACVGRRLQATPGEGAER